MLLNTEVLIFENFLKAKTVKITASQIAKNKKLNQKTVSNHLNKLENEKILDYDFQGRNKLFFLNKDNFEITKKYCQIIEELKTINLFKKKLILKEIAQKINPHIKGIALFFGSYIKNKEKEYSDFDVLIIGKCNESKIDQISKLYGINIEVKIFPRFEEDILLEEAIKNHICIKNTEQFITNFLQWIN